MIKAANQIQQRRLTRSGRPHHRDHLASFDPKVDIVERSDASFAFKAFGDPPKFNHRIHNLRRVESTRMRQSWFAPTTHSLWSSRSVLLCCFVWWREPFSCGFWTGGSRTNSRSPIPS